MIPRISVVTPCLNSGQHIERTLRSVLDQRYLALDYIVADGGSTDGSLAVIAAYRDRLSHVLSEPDRGHYDALNKGFARSTGEIMGWLNSNDIYMSWTLSLVGEIFAALPEVEWLTTTLPLAVDEADRVVASQILCGFSASAFYRGENLHDPGRPGSAWIQQEATFWRRSLWERAGGALEPLVACDFELWARFFRFAELFGVDVPLAGFRVHAGQRSQSLAARYLEEARAALARHGGRIPGRAAIAIADLLHRSLLGGAAAAAGLRKARPIVCYVPEGGGWRVSRRYA